MDSAQVSGALSPLQKFQSLIKEVRKKSDSDHKEYANANPELCLTWIENPTFKNIASLRQRISKVLESSEAYNWLEEFLENGGIKSILDIIEFYNQNNFCGFESILILTECINCLKGLFKVPNQLTVSLFVFGDFYLPIP